MNWETTQAQPRNSLALVCFREAETIRERLYPPKEFPHGHVEVARTFTNEGTLFLIQGQYDQAAKYFGRALAMNRQLFPAGRFPDGHPELASSLHNQGILLQAQGKYAEGKPFLTASLVMYQRLASSYGDIAAEAQALNYIATLPLARDTLLSLTRHLPADPSTYDVLWDARAPLTRLLERRHRDLLASRDDGTRDLGRQLAEARQRLAYVLLNPASNPDEHRREVEQRTQAKETLERRLPQKLKAASPRPDRMTPTPQRLRQLLPEDAVFVDLVHYSDCEFDPKLPGKKGERRADRYVAFVLRRDRPAMRVELKEASPIKEAWAVWHRAIIAARPDEKAERAAAGRLARLVWEPLRESLPAGVETVYLAPEGKLSQVPWGALPGAKPDTILLDECAVCLVPHGPYLLERLQEQAPPRRASDTLLVYGGIDYAGEAAPSPQREDVRAPLPGNRLVWRELPGTAREQKQVVALAKKVLKSEPIVRSRTDASTRQLAEDLPMARYAHLATHGFFADARFRSALQVDPTLFAYTGSLDRRGGARSPLVLSGLVLAGANRTGKGAASDRGIMTGEGLVGLPLEGLELAVLSACETGLGEDGGGEGIYGLQRAFHVAGCHNVIASLWKVDDQATQALMALFYRNLWEKKLDPAEALRQAQRTLYRHPEAIQLAQKRGLDFTETDLPKVEKKPAEQPLRSPTAHWAAFTFSGVRHASRQK